MRDKSSIPYCRPDSKYHWYRKMRAKRRLNSITLAQGDIIENVFKYIPVGIDRNGRVISDKVTYDACIVITQSCDLTKNDENAYDVSNVNVCPAYPLNCFFKDTIQDYLPKIGKVIEYSKSQKKPQPNIRGYVKARAAGKIKSFKANLIRGHLKHYYLLDKCDWGIFNNDYIIVDFRSAFTIDVNQLLKIISESGERLRLDTPYVEGLSQAYGLMYMRVARPLDIAKEIFESEDLPDPIFELPKEYEEKLKKAELI